MTVTVIVDLIHVLEYLWRAAWCFFDEGDTVAEAWVRDKALAVLNGQASTVAASIRRKATCLHLAPAKRANADTCADYLLRKRRHLDDPTALANGWPIATGVIEGACRHPLPQRRPPTSRVTSLQESRTQFNSRVGRPRIVLPSGPMTGIVLRLRSLGAQPRYPEGFV